MARAGDDAYSNGHQFFLVTGDTTLPADSAGGYTVVGTVTSGLDQLIAAIMSQGIDPATVGPTAPVSRSSRRSSEGSRSSSRGSVRLQ